MEAKQGWETLCQNLRQEYGGYDRISAYIHETHWLSFDPPRMMIGVETEQAKAWLEARATQLLQRQLAGIMNQEIQLQFVTLETEEEIGEEEEIRGMGDGEEMPSYLVPEYSDLYDAIVEPRKIVAIPGYFFRWLPYLKDSEAWLFVGMWQLAYLAHGKEGRLKPFLASHQEIARWSGISARTVQRHLQALEEPGNMLAWFLTRKDNPLGLANEYRLRLSMPLTPGDAQALRTWLLAQGIQDHPLETLEAALKCQPKEILPYPARFLGEALSYPPRPQTVAQVIKESCGVLSAQERGPLEKLATQLAARLIPPQDQIILTHYFLRHWVPLLKAGPAWLVTLLRDQSYFNSQTGELRDKILIEDGFQQLANALGIPRPKTLADWLPALEEKDYVQEEETAWHQRQENIRGYVKQFIAKTSRHGTKKTRTMRQWILQMALEEPLIPAHETILTSIYELAPTTNAEHQLLSTWLENEFAARLAQVPEGEKDIRGAFGMGPSDIRGANGIGSAARMAQVSPPFEARLAHVKALLIKHPNLALKIKPLLLTQQSGPIPEAVETDPENSEEEGGEDTIGETWDMHYVKAFTEMGGLSAQVSAALQQGIAEKTALRQRFMAWLLYAYVHLRQGEEAHGIKNPAAYARTRMHQAADPRYVVLAQTSPSQIALWLRNPYLSRPLELADLLKQLEAKGFLPVLEGVAQRRALLMADAAQGA